MCVTRGKGDCMAGWRLLLLPYTLNPNSSYMAAGSLLALFSLTWSKCWRVVVSLFPCFPLLSCPLIFLFSFFRWADMVLDPAARAELPRDVGEVLLWDKVSLSLPASLPPHFFRSLSFFLSRFTPSLLIAPPSFPLSLSPTTLSLSLSSTPPSPTTAIRACRTADISACATKTAAQTLPPRSCLFCWPSVQPNK